MRGIGGGEDAVGTGSEGGRSKNYEGGQDGLDQGLTCAGAWQVIFLLLFVAYFVIGVVSLAVDAEAMDAECAEDSLVWLYVLLVIVIPTSMGFVLSLVEVPSCMHPPPQPRPGCVRQIASELRSARVGMR